MFGVCYVGLGAVTGYYQVDIAYYFTLFAAYLILFVGMLLSVLVRPVWKARQYVGLTLDITAVSLAIFLTKEAISPFYLIYIWIFISAGTRYGRTHLVVASVLSVFAYNLVLIALHEWQRHTYEAVFFLLLLVLLPLYQHSLLKYDDGDSLHFLTGGGGGTPMRPRTDAETLVTYQKQFDGEGLDVSLLNMARVHHYCRIEAGADALVVKVIEVTGRSESPTREFEEIVIRR